MEVKSMSGVNDLRTASLTRVSQRVASYKGCDRRVRVDDVVLPFFHETSDAPGCNEDVLGLFWVTCPLDIPDMIKAPAADGALGSSVRESVYLPSLLSEVFGKRKKKGAQGDC